MVALSQFRAVPIRFEVTLPVISLTLPRVIAWRVTEGPPLLAALDVEELN